jgi:hypothetical protein
MGLPGFDPSAVARAHERRWALMLHTCRSQHPSGPAQLGRLPTFVIVRVNGYVAPIQTSPPHLETGGFEPLSHCIRRVGPIPRSAPGKPRREN